MNPSLLNLAAVHSALIGCGLLSPGAEMGDEFNTVPHSVERVAALTAAAQLCMICVVANVFTNKKALLFL